MSLVVLPYAYCFKLEINVKRFRAHTENLIKYKLSVTFSHQMQNTETSVVIHRFTGSENLAGR